MTFYQCVAHQPDCENKNFRYTPDLFEHLEKSPVRGAGKMWRAG